MDNIDKIHYRFENILSKFVILISLVILHGLLVKERLYFLSLRIIFIFSKTKDNIDKYNIG